MKNLKLPIQFLFAFLLLFSFQSVAQDFKGLDKSPMDVAAFPSSYKKPNKLVKVTYSRPQLKGRSLSKLAPIGKVWRTGANEAAEITFYQNMTIGGTKVESGTYSLFTIPGEDEWTIIINKAINVWGAYSYSKDMDVARVQAKVTEGNKSLEAFSIVFEEDGNNINMHLGWDKTRVKAVFNK